MDCKRVTVIRIGPVFSTRSGRHHTLCGAFFVLYASQKLPPEERQVKVLARMLSPAMMGLMVENRYDGVLKKQGRVLHSTKHDGQGIGLVSVETAVHRYNGNLTVETGGNVFRANVLLNL